MACEVLKIPRCISPLASTPAFYARKPDRRGTEMLVLANCSLCSSWSLATLPGKTSTQLLTSPRFPSQCYCRDSGDFPKVDPRCAPSRSCWEPAWMPRPVAAISARHRLPWAVPLAAPGRTSSPALRMEKPGLRYSSGPPIYQLLMCQHKWFTVFPFPRSATDWMTSRQEVLPL